jgi:hypothetical protein
MSDDKKPREFWISMCTFNDGYTEIYECRDGEFEPTPPAEKVHVIEHSAYDAIAKENTLLRESLKLAVDALCDHAFKPSDVAWQVIDEIKAKGDL